MRLQFLAVSWVVSMMVLFLLRQPKDPEIHPAVIITASLGAGIFFTISWVFWTWASAWFWGI